MLAVSAFGTQADQVRRGASAVTFAVIKGVDYGRRKRGCAPAHSSAEISAAAAERAVVANVARVLAALPCLGHADRLAHLEAEIDQLPTQKSMTDAVDALRESLGDAIRGVNSRLDQLILRSKV